MPDSGTSTPKYFGDRNAVIYTDQTWTAPASVAGETLSVNGHYCGHHKGKQMQDGLSTEATNNADAHYVDHNTIRYGTLMQDAASDANMPTKKDISGT